MRRIDEYGQVQSQGGQPMIPAYRETERQRLRQRRLTRKRRQDLPADDRIPIGVRLDEIGMIAQQVLDRRLVTMGQATQRLLGVLLEPIEVVGIEGR